jgi:phage-associated protein
MMPPQKHALLSASSAHRWLHCPPSAKLTAGVTEAPSEAALQGTAAHALAEHKLRRALKQQSKRPVSEYEDDEMDSYTNDYVSYVLEQYEQAKQVTSGAVIYIEQHLDFSNVVPGGFGTGDCLIVADGMLHVIDLKYGLGVLVEAEWNPQMMLYAIGALALFDALYDIEQVALTIFQPRRENVSTWTISVTELNKWAEHTLKPAAELAAKGEGEFYAGAWCQFCRIASTCRARAETNLELAKFEFAPPAELSPAEVAKVLTQIPELTRWASDVQDYALSQALSGEQYEGFKLVAGRSIRKYTDETAVAEAAKAAGYRDIYKRSLLTITAMEKLMGKKQFSEILGDLVVKPDGKPTLVPVTDKRPELQISTAADDFTNIDNQQKEGK